ncbi:hypothetical protein ES705_33731 [subsurface metagenome]
MAKEPLFPHTPKREGPLYPHVTMGQQSAHQLTVRFWDGTTKIAKDRDEAVRLVKEGLAGWMQKGDRIIWGNTAEDDKLGRKPSLAIVTNDIGEETDASALILYVTRGNKESSKKGYD